VAASAACSAPESTSRTPPATALAAPACYTGSAHSLPANSVSALARDPEWRIVRDVPFVAQQTDSDCGPAALAMVLAHFGAPPAATPELARGDVRAGTLRDVARGQGLEAYAVSGTLDDLFEQVARGRPVVVGLAKPMAFTGGRALAHYEVVIGLNRARRRILDKCRRLQRRQLHQPLALAFAVPYQAGHGDRGQREQRHHSDQRAAYPSHHRPSIKQLAHPRHTWPS